MSGGGGADSPPVSWVIFFNVESSQSNVFFLSVVSTLVCNKHTVNLRSADGYVDCSTYLLIGCESKCTHHKFTFSR